MIDKSNDKVDILIDDFFALCNEWKDKAIAKTQQPREQVQSFRGAHPRLAVMIAVIICILAVSLVIVGFTTPKTVVVNIDNSLEVKTTTYETTATRVDSFFDIHDVDYVYGKDYMDVQFYDGISNNMEINITKAVSVTLTADGETRVIQRIPTTVEEFLERVNVTYDEDDIVEPALDHVLKEGDKVVVKRVTKKYVTLEETTPYVTRKVANYGMQIGTVKTTQEGVNGLSRNTYYVTYIDGVEASKELTESEVITAKQDKIVNYGLKYKKGLPAGLKYKAVITNVKAVSYYFSGTPHGAYGLPCEYGTVAVDKKLIPLGSLLYIEDYGYAIANDVGSGIKGKVIDVYMEEYKQCLYWGARRVNVYIIEYGNNKKL